MTTTVDPSCGNCASLCRISGQCLNDEVLDALRTSPVKFRGNAYLCPSQDSKCNRFEPSKEAVEEAEAVAAYWLDLNRAAGSDYPATLGV